MKTKAIGRRGRLLTRGLCVASLLMLSMGGTCNGDGNSGESGGADQAAAVNLQLKVEGPDEIALKEYAITVTWHGDLVSGEGTAGNTNPFDRDQSFSATTDTQGDYVVNLTVGSELPGASVNNMRPGTWHFVVSANGWSGSCEQTLPAGVITSINFTFGKPDCANGIQFP